MLQNLKFTFINRLALLAAWLLLMPIEKLEAGANTKSKSTEIYLPPPKTSTNDFDVYLLYNKNFKGSKELALYYAKKRNIPSDKLIGLQCSIEEEISRQEYQKDIVPTVKNILQQHANNTRANERLLLVLFRGIPLKIKQTPKPPDFKKNTNKVFTNYIKDQLNNNDNDKKELKSFQQFNHNANINMIKTNRITDSASVDSELAGMIFPTTTKMGAVVNPLYSNLFPSLEKKVILVGRLDAASDSTVIRMIDDAISAEKIGLFGYAYIDLANFYKAGEETLLNTAKLLDGFYYSTIVDDFKAVFPPNYPAENVAFYFGWYRWNITGLINDKDFRFQAGSIATHLHSFNAQNLRDVNKNWAAGLLNKGAACTLGNVYEPFLLGCHKYDKFIFHLLTGRTFIESAYQSQFFLSWMNTAIGDPLYRPFGNNKIKNLGKNKFLKYLIAQRIALETTKHKAKLNSRKGFDFFIDKLKTMCEEEDKYFFYEGIGLKCLLNKRYKLAKKYLTNALNYSKPNSQRHLRITLHIANTEKKLGNPKTAVQILEKYLQDTNNPQQKEVISHYLELYKNLSND